MSRPPLEYSVVTATLKLEKDNMRRYENYLHSKDAKSHTKNNHIFNLVEDMVAYFKNADDKDKLSFLAELIPYATPRKKMNDDSDEGAFKCAVVSVKLKEDTYREAIQIVQNLGFSFSDIVRRLIMKDVIEAGF